MSNLKIMYLRKTSAQNPATEQIFEVTTDIFHEKKKFTVLAVDPEQCSIFHNHFKVTYM